MFPSQISHEEVSHHWEYHKLLILPSKQQMKKKITTARKSKSHRSPIHGKQTIYLHEVQVATESCDQPGKAESQATDASTLSNHNESNFLSHSFPAPPSAFCQSPVDSGYHTARTRLSLSPGWKCWEASSRWTQFLTNSGITVNFLSPSASPATSIHQSSAF